MKSCNCGVTGNVSDQHNRAIAGASVTLENLDLGIKKTATADEDGTFVVGSMPPGTYRLLVSSPGFALYTETLNLDTGAKPYRSVRLRIAPASEVVLVEEGRREIYQDNVDVGEVRESAAKDVGEALAGVDGVWKVRKGGIANDVVVRGFQQDNLNVLIDGARIHGACPNNMDPVVHHVDFAEVERVEIVKGAFDIANQGSLGGTVNIVNKTPAMGLRFKPSFSTGSFGFYNPSLTTSYGTERFKVLGGYSFRTSEPYRDGSGRSFTSYANYNSAGSAQKSFDIHTGWFTGYFSPTPNQDLSLGYTRQNGGVVLYPYLLMDAIYDNADRVNLRYSLRDLSSVLRTVRAQAYLTQVKHFMTDQMRTSSKGATAVYSMATNAATQAIGGRIETDLGRELTLGVESFHRNWNAMNYMRGIMSVDQAMIPNVDTQALGGFADYRRDLAERIRLNAGLRFDHTAMEALSPAVNSNLYFAYKGTQELSRVDNYPSANARITIHAVKGIDLFAGFGSTVRIPDAQERYFNQKRAMGQDVVGNPALDSTRNSEFTIGLNLRRGSSYLKPVLFYSNLSNYISVHNQPRINAASGVMNTSAKSWENVSARIYGGEMSYALPFRQDLLFSGGLSYSRGTRDAIPAATIIDTDLSEMPPLKTWAGLRYVFKSAFVEVSGVAAGRQDHVDTDLKEAPTPGYGLMNVKAGVNRGKLYMTLFVDNVLNRYYVEHFSYSRDPFRSGVRVPEPGRNVFAMASYSF